MHKIISSCKKMLKAQSSQLMLAEN